MFVLREEQPGRLVFGPERRDELVGLFLLGLGMLSLTVLFLAIFQRDQYEVNFLGVFMMAQYVAPAGFVGAVVLGTQQKLIVDKEHAVIIRLKPLRQPTVWKFELIAGIDVVETRAPAGRCLLRLRQGEPVQLMAGGLVRCRDFARLICACAGLPNCSEGGGPGQNLTAQQSFRS